MLVGNVLTAYERKQDIRGRSTGAVSAKEESG